MAHDAVGRTYRETVRPAAGEVSFQVVVEESDLFVLAPADLSREAVDVVRELRGQIKNHMLLHPGFGESLVPVSVSDSGPEVVRRMARAGELCGVGPMAAVAGTVAQMVAEALHKGRGDVVVENGGDVFLHSSRERVVALLPDPKGGSRVGIRIAPDRFPLAVCSSSGRIGHSLSLGCGDLVTVLSKDAAFADAAATALCNLLRDGDDVQRVLDRAQELVPAGLEGVFAQCGQSVAAWGDLELVAVG
ncbi:UPF0280 family protein [Pseudodesulfovibrio senegalensis]|uniref:UPF0280 family protein n=1 Tax=Pseudodesulfovibrio senegalensis TaxID=1721087 RepID=A0A6N6N4V3_9BACT|nr:UPF0280 family protein [Pseudodesulfovibrio senegalensis]KAB1442258.1 UPF0280 family protein [Pseudodesulfovibrio senegalensis]